MPPKAARAKAKGKGKVTASTNAANIKAQKLAEQTFISINVDLKGSKKTVFFSVSKDITIMQ